MITFPDGTKWVARIPEPSHTDSRKIESMVGTMRLITERTSLPLPIVHAYDSTRNNSLGFVCSNLIALVNSSSRALIVHIQSGLCAKSRMARLSTKSDRSPLLFPTSMNSLHYLSISTLNLHRVTRIILFFVSLAFFSPIGALMDRHSSCRLLILTLRM
ncbi:hypothetical protein IW261DRAFT_1470155 [Armillaria novae-zelandiae]|uniref:Aminoglycoside phosphotransferase domain-containing protein n=1 Tax=Armillaria novae-zelandiae TaxID=153914 RepID=A0AA39PBR2_9AGAR|nr:hypothetical protein IW261DRAFT_1470155 [Armillaria novae-zelandiae]